LWVPESDPSLQRVKGWIREFAPDWISLQFVPYSWHPKGWFGRWIPELEQVLSLTPRRHVFLHEIWIGTHRGASFKSRIVGGYQRHNFARLFRRIPFNRI